MSGEPTVEPRSSGGAPRGGREPPPTDLLERAELYIYLATASILVLGAAALLRVAVVETIATARQGDHVGALLPRLDRTLIVLMLAEIVYTGRRIAHCKRLDAEPFFIVGLIAAIRRILVITAESTGDIDLHDPGFQAAMTELGLRALIILALARAMRLMPTPAPERGPGLDRGDAGGQSGER